MIYDASKIKEVEHKKLILNEIKKDPYNISTIKKLLSEDNCPASYLQDETFVWNIVHLNGDAIDFMPKEMRDQPYVAYLSLTSPVISNRARNTWIYAQKIFTDEELTKSFPMEIHDTYVGLISKVKSNNQNANYFVSKYKKEYEDVMQIAMNEYQKYSEREQFKDSAITNLPSYNFKPASSEEQ